MKPKISRAVAADAVLAVAVGALGSADMLVKLAQGDTSAWAEGAAQLAAALALLARRRAPGAVGALCAALCLLSPVLAAPFAAYAIGVYGRGRDAAAIMLMSVLFVRPWTVPGTVAEVVLNSFSGTLVLLAPVLLGMWRRSQIRLIGALADRAERAEHERELMAEQARLEERARLAGEMHDVVTHRVSLMVLRAGALRTVARDEEVRAAVEELRQVGCQALEELRDLVGVLRSEDRFGSARTAEPVVLDLSGLVAESRAAGVEAGLACEGEPVPAPPVVARTAYRVVQEALTNVHKHAPGSEVTVTVSYAGDALGVAVRNTAAARGGGIALGGGGTGLSGLRQRVELLRGRLEAGATEEGGFAVTAVLPTGPGEDAADGPYASSGAGSAGPGRRVAG